MPRYCDVNNDKKITLSEWLNCLNAHGSVKEATKTSISEYIRYNDKTFDIYHFFKIVL